MKIHLLRNRLWFCTIVLVGLSFPLQVYTRSPLPALLPYLLIGMNLELFGRKRPSLRVDRRYSVNIDVMVIIYVLLVLLNTAWQIAFSVIGFAEAMNALVVYLPPVIFYAYFSRSASEEEIRSSLRAMIFVGLVVGLYFTYDSYIKLALGQVSDYSQAAFEYSVARSGAGADVNEARIAIGNRSHGLLESHSVSGAWVIIGALAALTLLPRNRPALRRASVLLFGTMVLLGLNFTAIIAFAIIMYLLEFSGITAARGRNSSVVVNFMALVLIVAIWAGVALWATGDSMSEFILEIFLFQTALALGTGEVGLSYPDIWRDHLASYYTHLSDYPPALLLGDGFSTYGIPKGSDIGLVETLATFGLPYFLVLMFCLVKLIGTALHQVRNPVGGSAAAPEGGLDRANVLQFSVGMTLLVLITDLHYTVWPAKSVLPIFFCALALYGRYSAAPRRSSLDLPPIVQTTG